MKKVITGSLAAFVTLTAMGMSIGAAFDRGGTLIDEGLFIALSLAVCAGSHFIPALSKRSFSWVLWGLCFLATVYSDVTFFTYAGQRAADYRLQHSAQNIALERQIEATRQALTAINARPVTTVANELALTKYWSKRRSLEAELSESRRAAVLRDGLVKLASTASVAEVSSATDLVVSRLAAVAGSSQSNVALVVSVSFAALLELVGAFLWVEFLRRPDDTQPPGQLLAIRSTIDELEIAIRSGEVKPTLKGIRDFLRCSQANAMEVRRALKSRQEVGVRSKLD